MSQINDGLMSSDRPDWNTPANFLAVVRRFAAIGLDPCSNAASLVGATTAWTEEDDGLPRSWADKGLVYCNPPYGREILPWAQKMQIDGARGAEIIALLPARTDARWWQNHITNADAVCFWRGRLRFLGAESSAPFPSAVAYWGDRRIRFAKVFGDYGWIVFSAPTTEALPLFARERVEGWEALGRDVTGNDIRDDLKAAAGIVPAAEYLATSEGTPHG